MNKSKIDWPWYPLWTWNPVVGCKHGCSYCYARRMNRRFKWIVSWHRPKWFIERMAQPEERKKPTNIFVGSMCDLFGEWSFKWWIQGVIDVTKRCPQHTFFFLTKNPARYREFKFPENCWLGFTATKAEDWLSEFRGMEFLMGAASNKSFLSTEPLLGGFEGCYLSEVNQVIVGAMTGPGAKEPKPEWIKSIKAEKIHFKGNILKYL